MSELMSAHEWLCNGGGGFEGGEEGLAAIRVTGYGLIGYLEAYRQYLHEHENHPCTCELCQEQELP